MRAGDIRFVPLPRMGPAGDTHESTMLALIRFTEEVVDALRELERRIDNLELWIERHEPDG